MFRPKVDIFTVDFKSIFELPARLFVPFDFLSKEMTRTFPELKRKNCAVKNDLAYQVFHRQAGCSSFERLKSVVNLSGAGFFANPSVTRF
jgi:hypothetical protein